MGKYGFCSGLMFLVAINSALLSLIGVLAFALGYPSAMLYPLVMQPLLPVIMALMCARWDREAEVQEEK